MNEALAALGIDDPRRRGRRIGAFAAIALLVVAGAAYAFVVRGRAERPRFETVEITRGQLIASVSATGSLRPVRTVDVGAEVSGRIVAVHADVNQRVHVGDVLVEIDTLTYSASVEQRRANVLEASAAIDVAEIAKQQATVERDRAVELHRQGILPERDVQQAQAQFERAEAELRAATARQRLATAGLRESSAALDRAVIRSPIDGVVLVRTVQPGQAMAATLSAPVLFQLAEDLEQMELHVDVDEADVGRVHEGMTATFVVDAYPDRTFTGRITRVAYAGRLVQNVVSYETVLAVHNPDLALRPGMTANATIVTETRQGVLLVPSTALRYSPPRALRMGRDRRWDEPRGPTLWVERRGEPAPISVEALGSDETRTEIRGTGVREGMRVIVRDAAEAP